MVWKNFLKKGFSRNKNSELDRTPSNPSSRRNLSSIFCRVLISCFEVGPCARPFESEKKGLFLEKKAFGLKFSIVFKFQTMSFALWLWLHVSRSKYGDKNYVPRICYLEFAHFL